MAQPRISVAIVAVIAISRLGFAEDNFSKFEVASIKPSPPGFRQPDCSTLPGGLFACHNIQLKYLLRLAFGTRISETKNMPSWFDDSYDIDAKVDSEREITQSEVKAPLLALFRERFGLVSHEEAVQENFYVLEQQPGGTKLKPSAPETALALKNSDEAASFIGETMPQFAARMAAQRDVNARVIDRTGLVGQFDFELPYVDERGADGNGGATVDPSVTPVIARRLAAAYSSTFDAVRSIGLRLRADKREGTALVIDQVHRPTEN